MALKENYKDDILDTSQNVKRKYQMENNGDGTVSFTDVTEYTQQGDNFGSGDINATNSKVNTLDANLDGFKFYPTGTGIVGLISDDSAYTDEDGNYVVWGTPTAEQLVEDNPNTYKSVPSEEDTRGQVGEDTAKSFGGNEMQYIGMSNRQIGNMIAPKDFSQLIIISMDNDNTIKSFIHNGISYSLIAKTEWTLNNTIIKYCIIPNVKKGDSITAPNSSYSYYYLQ